ncbi:MAG: hypothetical protein JO161_09450 [Planctomycetaceae bacterium]|nr:hypothetical protein [Planctomycetaceae bacterium]
MATDFVSLRQAELLSGLSRHMIMKFASMGMVRTDAKPGSNVRYNAQDAKELATTHAKCSHQSAQPSHV